MHTQSIERSTVEQTPDDDATVERSTRRGWLAAAARGAQLPKGTLGDAALIFTYAPGGGHRRAKSAKQRMQ
jgi:hypothetical protein